MVTRLFGGLNSITFSKLVTKSRPMRREGMALSTKTMVGTKALLALSKADNGCTTATGNGITDTVLTRSAATTSAIIGICASNVFVVRGLVTTSKSAIITRRVRLRSTNVCVRRTVWRRTGW